MKDVQYFPLKWPENILNIIRRMGVCVVMEEKNFTVNPIVYQTFFATSKPLEMTWYLVHKLRIIHCGFLPPQNIFFQIKMNGVVQYIAA